MVTTSPGAVAHGRYNAARTHAKRIKHLAALLVLQCYMEQEVNIRLYCRNDIEWNLLIAVNALHEPPKQNGLASIKIPLEWSNSKISRAECPGAKISLEALIIVPF